MPLSAKISDMMLNLHQWGSPPGFTSLAGRLRKSGLQSTNKKARGGGAWKRRQGKRGRQEEEDEGPIQKRTSKPVLPGAGIFACP